ncbi:MAG: DUF192 domain-containing protein [Patescibacteria group bacterium]
MTKKLELVAGVCAVIIIFGTCILFAQPQWSGSDTNVEVATTSQTIMNAINGTEPNLEAVIAKWYAPLTPFIIGGISLQASIADTDRERAQGLSDTPYIPAGIAKFFIFETEQPWSFWMKDMNYPIDIFWVNESGRVVHVVEFASPDSYPESFVPPAPAKYVIETKAGFAQENNIGVGAVVGMTQILLEQ